jgi:hypothetical protein
MNREIFTKGLPPPTGAVNDDGVAITAKAPMETRVVAWGAGVPVRNKDQWL